MNEQNEQATLAKELTAGQFLKLLFFGSVRSPTTGKKLAINSGRKKVMNVVGAHLPFIYLVLFLLGVVDLTWIFVVAFLVVVIVLYFAAMRSATLEETGS